MPLWLSSQDKGSSEAVGQGEVGLVAVAGAAGVDDPLHPRVPSSIIGRSLDSVDRENRRYAVCNTYQQEVREQKCMCIHVLSPPKQIVHSIKEWTHEIELGVDCVPIRLVATFPCLLIPLGARDLPVNVLGRSPVAIQLPQLLATSKPLALSSCTCDEGEVSFCFPAM
ncbi:hypothetical protein PsorP6_009291 [Peronosclerospora sorghi]|uniref:Uncharacterized protein n=1 Tax=Peronosclerospora sorghi TaxID=230839 RepID=A0ACC0W104_9STRA|nr:hypothetical protein PsorP6_009291 [Peronosclerospora sorghi]